MFPLKTLRKNCRFSGRTYNNQEPKYLNSPETPIFQRDDYFIILIAQESQLEK